MDDLHIMYVILIEYNSNTGCPFPPGENLPDSTKEKMLRPSLLCELIFLRKCHTESTSFLPL